MASENDYRARRHRDDRRGKAEVLTFEGDHRVSSGQEAAFRRQDGRTPASPAPSAA